MRVTQSITGVSNITWQQLGDVIVHKTYDVIKSWVKIVTNQKAPFAKLGTLRYIGVVLTPIKLISLKNQPSLFYCLLIQFQTEDALLITIWSGQLTLYLQILHATELEFLENLNSAKDLDQIIAIHNNFVATIYERCLLHHKVGLLKEAIMKVLNMTLTFQQWWDQGVTSMK